MAGLRQWYRAVAGVVAGEDEEPVVENVDPMGDSDLAPDYWQKLTETTWWEELTSSGVGAGAQSSVESDGDYFGITGNGTTWNGGIATDGTVTAITVHLKLVEGLTSGACSIIFYFYDLLFENEYFSGTYPVTTETGTVADIDLVLTLDLEGCTTAIFNTGHLLIQAGAFDSPVGTVTLSKVAGQALLEVEVTP